jgi:hypothetical protein
VEGAINLLKAILIRGINRYIELCHWAKCSQLCRAVCNSVSPMLPLSRVK